MWAIISITLRYAFRVSLVHYTADILARVSPWLHSACCIATRTFGPCYV